MSKQAMKRRLVFCAFAAAMALSIAPASAQISLRSFDLAEQSAASALREFAKLTGKQVLFPYDVVANRKISAIKGQYADGEVLKRIAEAAGLVVTSDDGKSITLQAAPDASGASSGAKQGDGPPGGIQVKPAPAPTSEKPEAPRNNAGGGLELQTIVVTAQRRSESIQDVPISTTAFTNQSMKRLGFQSATDVAAMSPNVNIQKNYGSANANIYIRGVGDSSFHVNQVGAVGIYQDEVSLNSPAVNMFQVFDLERIEVLRGPQNTLYGRNTTGGAINFISRKPDPNDGLNGDVSLTYGRFNQFDVEGGVGVPLTEDSALRVSMASHRRDAWMHNPTLDRDEVKEEKIAGRIQYLVRPSNSLEVLLNLHGGVNRGDNARYKSIGQLDAAGNQCPTAQASKVGGGCGNMFGFVDSGNFRENFANIPNPREELDANGASANIVWKLDGVTITSLTAYEGNKLKRNEDSDGSPNSIFEFYQQGKQDQYSQELRAASTKPGPLQWIVGGYYFTEEMTASTTSALRFASAGGSTQVTQHNDVWSAYGQGDYAVTDKLKFILGARYSVEKKDGIIDAYRYDPTGIAPGVFIGRDEVVPNAFMTLPTIRVDKTWRDWGGKIGLDYKFNPDVLLYSSVSRGFKGGGINIGAQQVFSGFDNFSVNPEYLVSYEAGAKTSWFNKRLRANVALYMSKYSDQQVFQGLNGVPILTNAGKSTIKGGEFELSWSPDSTWLINAGVGFTRARFDEFQFTPAISYAGKKLPAVPEVTLNGLVRKQFKIDDNILGLQLDFSHLSSQEFDLSNDPRFTEPSRTIVNLRGSYDFGPHRQYTFEIWAKNIGNERYCTTRIDLTPFGFIECTPSMPPSYGATFRYRF